MSKDSVKRKREQLGMPVGTAQNRLRKAILFSLVQRLEEDWCYQCGEQIHSVDRLSIEHKQPWLDVDPALFWDIDNIAFSHLECNVKAARPRKHRPKHGTQWTYNMGCRCDRCKQEKARVNALRYT